MRITYFLNKARRADLMDALVHLGISPDEATAIVYMRDGELGLIDAEMALKLDHIRENCEALAFANDHRPNFLM
jgi:hypothetical protein